MDQREQAIEFQRALNDLVERHAQEWDLSYVSLIGVLELQKLELAEYLFNGGEGDQEEEWASE